MTKIESVTLQRTAKDGLTGEDIPRGNKALRIETRKASSHQIIFYSAASAKKLMEQFTNAMEKL